MDISTRKLNQYTSELSWVITELNCVFPAASRNNAVMSSIHECIERLQFLNANLTRTARKGKKNDKHIYKREKGTGALTAGIC